MIAGGAYCTSAGNQKGALLANSSDGNRRTSVNDDFDVRHLSSASLAFARRAQKGLKSFRTGPSAGTSSCAHKAGDGTNALSSADAVGGRLRRVVRH